MSQKQSNYTYPGAPNGNPMPPMGGNIPPPPVAPVSVMRPQFETKNKFLTFLLGLCPGAGQMYHGLLKKGISIMLLFWGVTAISTLTYIGALAFLLPVIWFYSFFDTVNRMNMPVQEMRMLEDQYLFVGDSIPVDAIGKKAQELFQGRHVLIGWALVILAVWLTLNIMFNSGMGWNLFQPLISDRVYDIISSFIRAIPSFIIPVLCVLLGIKLIGSGKKHSEPKPPSYDEYTIPTDVQ